MSMAEPLLWCPHRASFHRMQVHRPYGSHGSSRVSSQCSCNLHIHQAAQLPYRTSCPLTFRANAMTEHVSELVKYFTAMERLLTLPLPTIYGIHLKQTVTLYLFILPLTLIESE